MKNRLYFILAAMVATSQLNAAESNVATITDVKEGVYYLMQDMKKINQKSDSIKEILVKDIESNKELIQQNSNAIAELNSKKTGNLNIVEDLSSKSAEHNKDIKDLKNEIENQTKILSSLKLKSESNQLENSESNQLENKELDKEIEQFITNNQKLL